MKLPFYYNGPLQSEYKLTGYKDATGTYHPTPFRKAFEHGGVYLFDEIDACSAQALVAFNTALANGMCDFPDRLVRQHADFVCLAAANTYGQGATTTYAGRERIDGATLDRFGMVEIAYDSTLEYRLAGNDDWVDRVVRIREIARESYPRLIVSMRASIQGAKMLRRGYSRDEVEKMFIWRGQLTQAQITDVQRLANTVRA
jgi:MoxR-like ATPase